MYDDWDFGMLAEKKDLVGLCQIGFEEFWPLCILPSSVAAYPDMSNYTGLCWFYADIKILQFISSAATTLPVIFSMDTDYNSC